MKTSTNNCSIDYIALIEVRTQDNNSRIISYEGNSVEDCISKVQSRHNNDPSFLIGFVYSDEEGIFDPEASLLREDNKIIVNKFTENSGKLYHQAVVTYWEVNEQD